KPSRRRVRRCARDDPRGGQSPLDAGAGTAEPARMTDDPIARLAAALERLAQTEAAAPDWLAAPAYVWTGEGARPVARIEAPPLARLRGIDRQLHEVAQNVAR